MSKVGIPWPATSCRQEDLPRALRTCLRRAGRHNGVGRGARGAARARSTRSPWSRSGLCAERAVRGQRTLDSDRVNVYHLRGGKIVEIWSYDSDPYALE